MPSFFAHKVKRNLINSRILNFLHHGIIQSNTEFFSFEICQLTQVNEDYLNAVSSGVLCSENRRVTKSALLHPNRESHAFCSCNEWRFDNILVSS